MAEFTLDFPFTFGDLICYRPRGSAVHDGPLLFVAFEPRWDTIAILDVAGDGHIEHKDPAMWQKCDHLGGFAPGIRDVSGTLSGPFTVAIGGVEVPATEVKLDFDRFVFDPPIVVTDDPIVITYDEIADG